MIEATIRLNVLPEKRTELLQTLSSMIEEIRKEKGCVSCNFFQDVDNENIFSLVEEWITREELDIYLKSDMFSALIGTKSLLAKPVDITIREVSHITGIDAVIKVREEKRSLDKN